MTDIDQAVLKRSLFIRLNSQITRTFCAHREWSYQQLSKLYSCTCWSCPETSKQRLRELPRKLELPRHFILLMLPKLPWSWHTEPCPEPSCRSLRRTPWCPAPSWPSAKHRSNRRCSCSGSCRQHGTSWSQLFPTCSWSSLLFGDQRPDWNAAIWRNARDCKSHLKISKEDYTLTIQSTLLSSKAMKTL